jgi:hypothetical protein
MAGEDIIEMSLKELRKLKAVQDAIDGKITQKQAALVVGLSERQIRRLVCAVRVEGERGITHGLRGIPSNRRFKSKVKERVLRLYRSKYPDFGPTLACEKLLELDGIRLSAETLRTWLIEAGLWRRSRKGSTHRRWRVRKECFGEMTQMDGSHHDWLEGRCPKFVLMGYIDDATSNIFGRFYDYEGTIPAMDSFKRYTRKYGLPVSVYLDRHSTYKSTKKLTEWEELEGLEPMSQFERALSELGVRVIHAHSPQAKGRVERLFGTLQDRLVKEMRLRDIRTMEEANKFLEGYLPKLNKMLRVAPANETDAHMKLPKGLDLDGCLCIKTERTLRKDNTISLDGRLFQIEDKVSARKVRVEERTDGSMLIISNGAKLKYKEITEIPKKESAVAVEQEQVNRPETSGGKHPYQKWDRNATPDRRVVL